MAKETLTLEHLKPFSPTVCWLHTRKEIGDNYVGLFHGMNVLNGNGHLNLREMRIVARIGNPRKLRAYGDPQTKSFELDDCKVSRSKSKRHRLKITTSQGDTIFLSREFKDVKRVQELISPKTNGFERMGI
ncbi:MAG: hypothetical protein KGI45_02395 [Patescibacteria group bacterium]|nr:hypothetical protein [Patescibacteria group bacterium]MDE1940563.1 hypothetical protein [Patescibacteria group bacterium]MDE1966901.1 hypothetical protein [Patescibacteria group bacterium]